ncbi:universal stress protein family domain protein [Aspergillus novofumigatus IBT 16806]|uniref:Universal stress protein family domain protein n=1 Tax=Aspergillus novofumigatus (strain IBT 16806) TaxID=1392255 RepID=A0A2I1CNB7_ASPN1|nr:universal stress protein family domain protein [Aspergillus novofumigatus IBT 16806]PKX99127.1 universal stress protein family domain protein [Aspergillus novofumigatus IBT 16806]
MAAYNSNAYNRTKRRARSSLAGALESERLEWVEDERLESGPSSNRRPPAQVAPVRSQLDTAPSPDILPPRHGSIAGIGVGVTSPSNNRRSWAGPVSESASPSGSGTPGTATSYASLKRFPGESSEPSATRRASDNSDQISIGKKKIVDRNKLDNNEMPVLPKRTIQIQLPEKPPREPTHHHKPSQSKSAMAAMMSGFDLKVSLPSFARGRTPSRQNSSRGRHSTLGFPSDVLGPALRIAGSAPCDLAPKESESPEPDINTATSSTGDERLAKDLYDSENNPMDSSEDEPDESSSSDDDSDGEIERGRKKAPNASDQAPSLGQVDGATDERDQVIEEKLKATSLSDQKPTLVHSAKQGPHMLDVHPRTSFDPGSALSTPFGSDDEAELSDIKRAQKLTMQLSAIDTSVPNRSIRTIIRGDFARLQEESEGGRHRQRKYLVATDLSEESVYALEWTIGTILRDGDTMFAVCAVNEELGIPFGSSVQIGEGAQAMQDAAAIVGSQTEETVSKSQNDSITSNLPRALLGRLGQGTDSKPSSVDARGVPKGQQERNRAVEIISQTCVRLLRKTLLQVRVAVEVIHCKSPKHMITEAIDGLEPTLVIVGARGRSALKGVLLGSFSNYLVMNSSVPVMVARKKLRKQTKNKKTNVRLSNNLATPKKLAFAKVD